MRERYRTRFLAIIVLTVVWLIIILLCLRQSNDVGQWASKPFGSVAYNRDGKQSKLPTNFEQVPQSHQTRSLNSLESLNHIVAAHKMSLSEKIYYQFNPIRHTILNESSPSKELHINNTLAHAKINSPTDRYIDSEGRKLFAFNLLVSNRIGLFRPLPDTRNPKCHSRDYTEIHGSSPRTFITDPSPPVSKYQASIIICYYNEAPSALLRTIHTVLERSPPYLLQEIIIVDDFSHVEFSIDRILPFLNFRNVVATRTSKREGLIRARLFGASLAQGEALVFLDSHVEANIEWLEPLISTVRENRTTIACPMIDLINADTLIYSSSPMVKGGLNWALHFKWDSVPSDKLKTYDDFIKPIDSPTMAGGLYAIDRDFFHKLGEYDSKMDLWGGENVELSLRAWMCGGKIVILPCSRVGHIFRKNRPYGPEPNQPDSLLVNSHRTARIWLDEYIHKFYEKSPSAKNLPIDDISQRVSLRQKLGCRNFSWYLDNIYPKLKAELATIPVEITTKSLKISNRDVNRETHHKNLVNSRLLRQASGHRISSEPIVGTHANRPSSNLDNILSESANPRLDRAPRVLSKFQIQSAEGNLCIESVRGFLAKSFTRLVLNHCAVQDDIKQGAISNNNSSLAGQLWTETTIHDYRLGENMCLDLIKNLPMLRKCHNIGSFQDWRLTKPKTEGTYIRNSGTGLCLGVEQLSLGEPIIVTICNREDVENRARVSEQERRMSMNHPMRVQPSWRTGQMLDHDLFRAVRLRPSEPYQKWTLLYLENPSPLGGQQQD